LRGWLDGSKCRDLRVTPPAAGTGTGETSATTAPSGRSAVDIMALEVAAACHRPSPCWMPQIVEVAPVGSLANLQCGTH
jgi:hypothetical protein